MPEYSSTTITPADGVQVPSMNGSAAGNFLLSALRDYILASKGQANGLASLDGNGKLTEAQLPDLADDVIVVDSYSTIPAIGKASKIYITADNNKGYRWDPELTTPDYVKIFELDKSIVFGYYSSGSFYEDSEHTVQITPVEHVFYVDVSLADIYVLNDGTLIELLGTKWAKITDIQDGTIQAGIAVKAFQDAMGRAIITTYETKAEASELKSAIQATNARVENLEQEHGGYVTVNYRGTNSVPTGKAKYGLVESLVGKSRGWNNVGQSVGTIPYYHCYMSSFSDGVATVINFVDSSAQMYISGGLISGHDYLCVLELNPSKATKVGANFGTLGTTQSLTANTWQTYAYKGSASGTVFGFRFDVDQALVSTDTIQIRKLILRDLTIIFPEGVPATVAECVQKCPSILDYDAYGYSLVDTVVEGVKSVGVNIVNEATLELGDINSSTGVDFPSSLTTRLEDYARVEPDTSYYILNDCGATGIYFRYYDINKNYLGDRDKNGTSSMTGTSGTRLMPSNCYYLRLVMTGITAYTQGLQICLNSYTDKTTYHPYMTDTLSLPTSVTLRSAGSVAEVYDLETGEKTNPIGSIDLGTVTWYKNPDNFGINFYTVAIPSVTRANPNILCSKYPTVPWGTFVTSAGEKTITMASSSQVRIRDSAYDDYTGDEFQSEMSGVILNYELATPDDPTQLTPVIDNTIQTEGGGTINTIQTQTTKIDNCLDVGYLAL